MKVAAEAARRFLVARHLLAPARALAGGPDAVLEVFRRFGAVQFDPIAVAGRSHDLVLHARVADYDPAWCELLYERREIFEAYNKGLSLVLASEYPWFRATLGRSARQTLADNAEVAGRVLDRVRADGPLGSLDFEREQGPTTDWFGAPTNTVRAVLEAYAVTGVLGLARRDGNRRYYDLIERLLPDELLTPEPPLREQMRHKLLSRYRAHGLLGVGGADGAFSGIGTAKPDPRLPPGHPGRDALREELVERGDLVPVQVEGVTGRRFVLRDEVELLDAPPEPPPSVAFLPRSTRSSGTASCSGACSASSTSGSCSCRPPSAAGAGTSCRSSSATASSAGSSRGSSARTAACGCSTSGGRTGSSRGARRGSWTRCATRSAPTSASPAPTASTGPPTSARSGGCTARARRALGGGVSCARGPGRSPTGRGVVVSLVLPAEEGDGDDHVGEMPPRR